MNLKNKLAETLETLSFSGQGNCTLSWKDIMPLIDLTLLDSTATPQNIHDLATKANLNQVAAICVLPEHLGHVSQKIKIKRATVINFPTGNQPQQHVLATIEQTATHQNVDEIDYVFPYQRYLAGSQHEALSCCHEAYQLCKQHDLTFKVILETGALPSLEVIYDLSMAIIDTGCDFLKTSTGKIAQGASVPAVFSMLSAINDCKAVCGIKVSGGVKSIEKAIDYMKLAQYMQNRSLDSSWFRLGASGLLDVLIDKDWQALSYYAKRKT